MKRRMFNVVVFLLLGAVLNVAVAWACALVPTDTSDWKGVAQGYSDLNSTGADHWLIYKLERRAAVRIHSSWGRWRTLMMPSDVIEPASAVIPSWAPRSELMRMVASTETGNVVIEGVGWPALAMMSRFEVAARDREGHRGWEAYVRDAPALWVIPSNSGMLLDIIAQTRVVPIVPIWPGFVLNALFYGTTLWLLICGPFALRRLIRRKRGLCVPCGYDLRGNLSAGCPECGWRREVTS